MANAFPIIDADAHVVETERTWDYLEGAERDYRPKLFSTPEDVATLVVLLASERTKNVTGSNYVIDGGLIKTT